MPRLVLFFTAACLLVSPSPAAAWGYAAHKVIMGRAIALLPPELRPFFEHHRAVVVERSIDPDTWRTAGFDQEPPNHFLDLDWEGFGKYPFNELPRDFTAAVAKFGRERIDQMGRVPWRVEEFHGNLRRAFDAYNRRGTFAGHDILVLAAALAHYVSDAHVPFHAIYNYDGQLTGQHGVHARWESIMFERYEQRLRLNPTPIQAIANPRNFIFDRLLEGTQQAQEILASDRTAIGDRDVYDDAYFDAFFAANQALMERRLNESIAGVAAMITSAWQAAGRPAVPLTVPTPPQRKRRG